MSELSFDDYAYHAWSTAYFLDIPDDKARSEIVRQGFNEEVNELLTDETYGTELRELLWGRTIDSDVKSKLCEDKVSEAGDVLYFIASNSMLRHIPLGAVASRALILYTGSEDEEEDLTLESFDRALTSSMPPQVMNRYNPEYFGMQMFGCPPFRVDYNNSDNFDGLLNPIRGPLELKADGLYALERLTRNFSESIADVDGLLDEKNFNDAALLLGGLSIVLQNRFDSTLEEAAFKNMEKRERRQEEGTLEFGNDSERSRAPSADRPVIEGWLNTELNLIYSLSATLLKD